VDGKFSYNPVSVPFYAEIFKLFISIVIAVAAGRQPELKLVNRRNAWLYAPPAFLFWMSNNARMLSYQYLDPPVLQLMSNLRTTFTAFFTWMCIKRQFSSTQWLAIILLPISMVISDYKASLLHGVSSPGWATVRHLYLVLPCKSAFIMNK
jgi:drug/metabolite transporter (DMT)-like permease